MELQAAIEALRALDGPRRVVLVTDSQYLRQGITQWLPQWQQRNWQTSQNEDVKNQDLWRELARQLKRHEVTWQWTKGHANNEWNERANFLAQSAIPRVALPLDDDRAVHLFTAASYLGKSKTGGWAVVLRYRNRAKTLSGKASGVSSNRMHLMGAVEGLRAIQRPVPVHIYTTSDYLKDGATTWVKRWAERGWQTREGKPVSHQDLWQELSRLTATLPVTWHVVSKENLPAEMVEAKEIAGSAARAG